jgi:hypothetical protein
LRWVIENKGEYFHEWLNKNLSCPFGSRDRRGVITFFTPIHQFLWHSLKIAGMMDRFYRYCLWRSETGCERGSFCGIPIRVNAVSALRWNVNVARLRGLWTSFTQEPSEFDSLELSEQADQDIQFTFLTVRNSKSICGSFTTFWSCGDFVFRNAVFRESIQRGVDFHLS